MCDGTVVQADSFMTPLEMMLPVKNDTTQHLFAVEQKMNSSTHCKLQDRNYYEGKARTSQRRCSTAGLISGSIGVVDGMMFSSKKSTETGDARGN